MIKYEPIQVIFQALSRSVLAPPHSKMTSMLMNGRLSFKIDSEGKVDMGKVIFQLCFQEFKYHRSSLSLKYHLDGKHYGLTSSGPTKSTSSQPKLSFGASTVSKVQHGRITDAIAWGVGKNSRPISICEDEGFAKVLKEATGDRTYAPVSSS